MLHKSSAFPAAQHLVEGYFLVNTRTIAKRRNFFISNTQSDTPINKRCAFTPEFKAKTGLGVLGGKKTIVEKEDQEHRWWKYFK